MEKRWVNYKLVEQMNKLIIERVELFKVPPRCLFLKITTKEGIIGWGDPFAEGKADTVAACVQELQQYLISIPSKAEILC